MGNPDFAIPTLRAIRQSGHELISVVSNPPKQMGRGRTLSNTPVGKFSKENDIPLLEPESLRSEEFINRLNDLKPDIFVVVAYRILPNTIIEIPTYGAINLHASLLPKYRGAGPIQWALMNGDGKTGVTIFQIKREVDTGDILMQKEIEILEEDNMLSLGTRLCEHGANMIIKVLDRIDRGSLIKGARQDPAMATPAPKIKKDMTTINWDWPSEKIHNWVRGLSPFPGMSTSYKGKRLRLFKTKVMNGTEMRPGSIIETNDNRLIIGTGQGALEILELQIEGRKKMRIDDFLRGIELDSGELLG